MKTGQERYAFTISDDEFSKDYWALSDCKSFRRTQIGAVKIGLRQMLAHGQTLFQHPSRGATMYDRLGCEKGTMLARNKDDFVRTLRKQMDET